MSFANQITKRGKAKLKSNSALMRNSVLAKTSTNVGSLQRHLSTIILFVRFLLLLLFLMLFSFCFCLVFCCKSNIEWSGM